MAFPLKHCHLGLPRPSLEALAAPLCSAPARLPHTFYWHQVIYRGMARFRGEKGEGEAEDCSPELDPNQRPPIFRGSD